MSILLAGCASTPEKVAKPEYLFGAPFGPPMTGEIIPYFYFIDRKFPVFTVGFNGEEYSLEGYHEPPGHDRLKYFFAYQNARDFLLGKTFTCHETFPWHLMCFNSKGENMRQYLEPKPMPSQSIEKGDFQEKDRDYFDTLFFLELPQM